MDTKKQKRTLTHDELVKAVQLYETTKLDSQFPKGTEFSIRVRFTQKTVRLTGQTLITYPEVEVQIL